MIYIEDILREGLSRDASDIHLVKDQKPLFRVRKELKRMEQVPELTEEDIWNIYRYFIKDNDALNQVFLNEKKLDLNFNFNQTRLRVNISSSMESMIFTIRLINQVLPSYDALRLPDVLRKLASLPQGLILVTGKSNSGKSTTLNSIINEINKTECKKILTLENPIEYVHTPKCSLIVQKEVGPGKDCTKFSEGVKNALREDCDILVVGEIRDKETMDATIEMTESGHLVIGTMHTRSCSETVDRILNFYQLDEQMTIKNVVSGLLLAVVSQRLLKGLKNDLVLIPEVMIVDDVVSALIRKEKFTRSEIEDAIQTKMDKGSIGLLYSLAEAVVENRISEETAKSQIVPEKYEALEKIIRQKNSYGNGDYSSDNSIYRNGFIPGGGFFRR